MPARADWWRTQTVKEPGNEDPKPNEKPKLKLPLANPRVVIKKGSRKLLLYDGNKLMKTYKIGLSMIPFGDKEKEGDRRTPLGDFYICTRNENSRFHLFLGPSYPDVGDAERGLKTGEITDREFDAIIAAQAQRLRPPWKTGLGGEIGIHGNGTKSDWTAGCIALSDEDMDELWAVLKIGDPVTIEP